VEACIKRILCRKFAKLARDVGTYVIKNNAPSMTANGICDKTLAYFKLTESSKFRSRHLLWKYHLCHRLFQVPVLYCMDMNNNSTAACTQTDIKHSEHLLLSYQTHRTQQVMLYLVMFSQLCTQACRPLQTELNSVQAAIKT
jgi:hypothetical protein